MGANTDKDDAAQVPVDPEARVRAMSRRGFVMAGIAAAATLAGFEGLMRAREEDGLAWPLRRILQGNERVVRGVLGARRSAPLLTLDRVTLPARVNGDLGLGDDFDSASWTLTVSPALSPDDDADEFTLDQIMSLPKHEMITELHCIEGWTIVQRWAGARFSDFVARYTRYKDPRSLPAYVGMSTPDGGYYVGLDIEAAMHPQTLLCYEMNGEPLTLEHGAPLRLVIPVKYGVKNIKRIGEVTFSNARPDDYWAQQGYDWYAGL
ncbi:MAG: molybdopterin-dependent oxidoreductase [Capsulimonadaceae bacterium]|nr:molybdopterin-dependent oxidoreductase [Capsulimonadaceae bacterium]